MKRKTGCCFSGAVKKVKTKVLSSEGELKSRIKVIDQLGRTGKVRLQNADFQLVNHCAKVDHCGYLYLSMKQMEPGSCCVTCNGDISDFIYR